MGGMSCESKGRGCMCTYGWFTSLYSRNQHNTIKKLSSKKKKKVRHGKWAWCVGWWKENRGRVPEAVFWIKIQRQTVKEKRGTAAEKRKLGAGSKDSVREQYGGSVISSRWAKSPDTHLPGITDCLVPSTQRSQWMRATAPLVFHSCPILWKCSGLFQIPLFFPDPPWCWLHRVSAHPGYPCSEVLFSTLQRAHVWLEHWNHQWD